MPARTSSLLSGPSPAMAMDPGIWGRLPGHLLERILALLPLRTLLNLRPTCKHFNSLLVSPCFLSLTNISHLSSFLLLSHPQSYPRFPLYDALRDRWRMLAVNPIPLPPNFAANLLSTSNGLLCFSFPNSFLLCNSITKSIRTIKLPSCPFTSITLISSSPSSTAPHGYKIFTRCSVANTLFVYDSGADSWTQFSGFDPTFPRESSAHEGVSFNGYLYFTTREPFSVVGFDLGKGGWERLVAPMPVGLTFTRLVTVNGDGMCERLLLVGGVGRDGISRNLKVWELRDDGSKWEEVAALPELMCRKMVAVCYHNYEHIYCLWHEGLVCVCCYNWPEILVYKLSRGTWHWLPRCPFLPEKWSCGFKWFSFVPDVYALV